MGRLLLVLGALLFVPCGCASEERTPEAQAAARPPRPALRVERIGSPDLRVLLPGAKSTEALRLKRGRESFVTYDLDAHQLAEDVTFLLEEATYDRLRTLAIQILCDPPKPEAPGQEVLLDLLMRLPDVERSGLERSGCKFVHRPAQRVDVDEFMKIVRGLLDQHRSDPRPR